jgi:hypothetical protein
VGMNGHGLHRIGPVVSNSLDPKKTEKIETREEGRGIKYLHCLVSPLVNSCQHKIMHDMALLQPHTAVAHGDGCRWCVIHSRHHQG